MRNNSKQKQQTMSDKFVGMLRNLDMFGSRVSLTFNK